MKEHNQDHFWDSLVARICGNFLEKCFYSTSISLQHLEKRMVLVKQPTCIITFGVAYSAIIQEHQ
jgi:hypothetical protein